MGLSDSSDILVLCSSGSSTYSMFDVLGSVLHMLYECLILLCILYVLSAYLSRVYIRPTCLFVPHL